MTEIQDIDIFISGGGVAGLAASIAFAQAGYSTLTADPAPPITDRDHAGADLRTTAFLQPAKGFLDKIGIWASLADHATPLQIMRIVDAGGAEATPRAAHDFNASDISDQPFGWNLPNWLLRREMVAHLDSLPTATFCPGTGTANVVAREKEALITLTDGRRLRAKLVVGADGRASRVREALGITVRTTRYGQKALAFAVHHAAPHDNISTEVHRSGGPFTLVPLPDRDGKPCSAVVWMDKGAEIARLKDLPDQRFEAEMTERSAGVAGPLTLASRRTVWPIISQLAEQLTGPRTALVAEAAHVMPPIGAQGLNMSLSDIATLLEEVTQAGRDPGEAGALDRYARARHKEIAARVAGVDALNRASMADTQALRDLRLTALNTLYSVAPVRRVLMRAGLGATR